MNKIKIILLFVFLCTISCKPTKEIDKPTRDKLVGANKEIYIKLEQIENKIDLLLEQQKEKGSNIQWNGKKH